MGGTVGVVVKKENGEQLGMLRWTNSMPYFFSRLDLYSDNTNKWYKEFTTEWLDMKIDYERNKDTGQYEHNMTDSYFPHDTLSPESYGIIAVDMQNKKIYSSQNYCHIGAISIHNIWNMSARDSNTENIETIKEYVEHGFLKEFVYYDISTKTHKKINISKLTADELIRLFTESTDDKIKQFSHPLFNHLDKTNMSFFSNSLTFNSDWKFSVNDGGYFGVLEIKKEMEQDGFIFSDADNDAWKKYFEYAMEDMDDEYHDKFKELYLDVFKEPYLTKEEKAVKKPSP